MKYLFKLVSSLEKVFFTGIELFREKCEGSMLSNEIYSFQLVGWCSNEENQKVLCTYRICSELQEYIDVKCVSYVPNLVPSIEINDDCDYITKTPGLFPDVLLESEDQRFELSNLQTRALWISICPSGHISGSYPITIQIYDANNEIICEKTFLLDIIPVQLPELSIPNTCWFYGDCIAKLHHVEIMSEDYFEIAEKYLDIYSKFGHNMILTPIFTPPLNTAVGAERPTNQLVGVTITNGQYSFDFSLLNRWISICQKHNIRYYEISHLFTQWGAEHSPKIMATVDGEYKRIFGWETDSCGNEYQRFLSALLPELTAFLKKLGIYEQCYFHISDEPFLKHQETYKRCKELVSRFILEDQIIDALADYDFYENGLIHHPVVCSDMIQRFIDHGASGLWTYYCMAQRKGVANRFMAMPSYRSRVLGLQLYKNEINGFLHWGFNFWFSADSQKVINPYFDSTADGHYQGGDSYLVYPLNEKGEVVLSLRLYVVNEAMQDYRALSLLESISSRGTVLNLLNEIVGMSQYPREGNYYISLREKINSLIKEKLCI